MSTIVEKFPRLQDELAKHPKPASMTKPFGYGTAGFRTDSSLLSSTLHRMGIMAVLRSMKLGKIVGLMVTASHNMEPDNGVKLIDPDGGMLASSWEEYAMNLANADTEKVPEVIESIVNSESIDLSKTGNIFIARDTRASSEQLAEVAREGALLVRGNVDFSLQTTPQLHHLVRLWNYEQYNKGDWASEAGYYNMMVDAFKQLTKGIDARVLEARGPLFIDAAHGIGAIQMSKLGKEMKDLVQIVIRNLPSDGELNHECGAEHVQKGRKFPSGFSRDADRGKRCCSFDGDADRVVYHYFDSEGQWHLLDGDKIAALFATFFKENLEILGNDATISYGVVQTAYANGASTEYLNSLNIPVGLAKTGVKYCHEKALDYDIGIYFEANGHGTAMFKDATMEKLQKLEQSLTDDSKKQAVASLIAANQLINQAVGDAMSDALFVEAFLSMKEWDLGKWDSLYTDLPSRQTKIAVADRSVIKCNEDETQALAPEGLQAELDKLMSAQPKGRAFVRPSGTEDVVRVYAEAETEEAANELALQVAKAVYNLAGGVGDEPASV